MAPMPDQGAVGQAATWLSIIAMVIGAPIVVVFLPPLLVILSAAIYIYLRDIWRTMIRDPKAYREWNRLRKQWNKAVVVERRRRFIMSYVLDRQIQEQGLSEEERFRYAALVRNLHKSKDFVC